MTATWIFTDDPDDPCALCVVWEEQPGDLLGENARPVWPDGATVERIYQHTHGACMAAVIAYTSEVEA